MTEEDRRQYVRTAAHMRFTMKPLTTQAELEEATADVMTEPADNTPEHPEVELDAAHAQIMEAIQTLTMAVEELSERLDHCMARVEGAQQAEPRLTRLPLRELSGGGFRFLSHEPLDASTPYLVTIDLSRFPHVTARCIGRARWTEELTHPAPPQAPRLPPAKYNVGMEIEKIRESDRDRLIHTIFRLQRERIRAERESAHR